VYELAYSPQQLNNNFRLANEQQPQHSSYNTLDSSQMHPQMSQQQYIHNDFGMYSSPHMNNHHPVVANPTQPLAFNGYDSSNYAHDPYAQFDMSKPVNQFQYMQSPQQQQQQQHPQAQQMYQQNQLGPSSVNSFVFSTFPQNAYPAPESHKRHQPNLTMSSDDSAPSPTPNRKTAFRVPKFDRTYTDALEDELYDESTSASQSVNSQSHDSRHATPGFAFNNANHIYMDKNAGRVNTDGRTEQAQHQQQPSRQQHQTQGPNNNCSTPGNLIYAQNDQSYDPLGDRQSTQRLSSTAVADSIRRLQMPNRTTVSPREAFLDYPDNADFRERTLFSKSTSPYSQGHDAPEAPSHQGSNNNLSNEDDYSGSEVLDHSMSFNSVPYSMADSHSHYHPTSIPISSRSNSASTRKSTLLSGDVSVESSNGSDSEYDPTTTSARRGSRSSGRLAPLNKTFSCSDCGKRFDKAQPLQAHRRNSHGKGNGPPTLNSHKFSNTSHRCDWVDPTTGKMCNTVFSRP
jgi:hypothetical protein